MDLLNISRFALSHPRRFAIMAAKVWKRFTDPVGGVDQWTRENESDADAFAQTLDATLWQEAKDYEQMLQAHGRVVMKDLPEAVIGSGSGFVWLLYFLTRHLKPEIVFETGVALGWSSAAILAGLEKNGTGHLYSSDFPLFRVAQPEKYIGWVVEEHLKSRWTLCIEGDRECIRTVLKDVKQIDLLHYDSDKSYSGRAFVLDSIALRLRGPVVMDDIADNSFFKDYVQHRTWRVFRNRHVPVGLIGL